MAAPGATRKRDRSKDPSREDIFVSADPADKNQNNEAVAVMEVQSGRVEKRLPMNIPVWISRFEHPGPFERATTENVSAAGARIVVKGNWQPKEAVVVLCSPGCIANAHVVYSQALAADANRFAIGVRLQSARRARVSR